MKARLRAVGRRLVYRDCSHLLSDRSFLVLLVVEDVHEHRGVQKMPMLVLHLDSVTDSTRMVQYGPQDHDHQGA